LACALGLEKSEKSHYVHLCQALLGQQEFESWRQKAWATDRFAKRRERRIYSAVLIGLFVVFLCVIAAYDPGVAKFVSDSAQPAISSAGILLGLGTFIYSQMVARHQSRKQHTIKILFDTRLSTEFRKILDNRRAIYPSGTTVPHAEFVARLAWSDSDVGDDSLKQKQRDAVEAVRALLNYYEFISLGILTHDLDEEMLRESLRSIMSNLVRDTMDIIQTARLSNPKLFENLTIIYNRWRDPKVYPPIPTSD
jgi:hypothetical protein